MKIRLIFSIGELILNIHQSEVYAFIEAISPHYFETTPNSWKNAWLEILQRNLHQENWDKQIAAIKFAISFFLFF